MNLDSGSTQLNSWMGSICSFFLIGIVLAYVYQKVDVLLFKRDVDILQTTAYLALTDQDEFNFDKGLNIAVAFTGYDSDTEMFDDPTIGQVVFNHYQWGENPDGSYSSGRFPINSHTCSSVELGLEGNPAESKFLPINENFKSTV